MKMTKAIIIKKNTIVYIHDGVKPTMPYNAGMLVVSKQPNSGCIFCVKKEDLKIVQE